MFANINHNLKKVQRSLQNLINDTQALSSNAVEGNLEVRADVDQHEGEYRNIVVGINRTLDVIIKPLREAEKLLNCLAVNDLEVSVSEDYKGEFNVFFSALSGVKESLLSIQDTFVGVSKGETTRLAEFKALGKKSENDKLLPSATAMMQTLSNLISEANRLAAAAIEGNLSARGNTDSFEGGFKLIIDGMNRTMEAVAAPINESATVLQRLSEGDLTISMNGNYQGEYSRIKDSVNGTVRSFNSLLDQINIAASEVSGGSQQVSSASQSLTQGTTEQASVVEQLLASITDVAARTRQNALNANDASELASDAQGNARSGNEKCSRCLTR
jgi:methyl-accepting chemotaxis protein